MEDGGEGLDNKVKLPHPHYLLASTLSVWDSGIVGLNTLPRPAFDLEH
jgi:hypothetical protein